MFDNCSYIETLHCLSKLAALAELTIAWNSPKHNSTYAELLQPLRHTTLSLVSAGLIHM